MTRVTATQLDADDADKRGLFREHFERRNIFGHIPIFDVCSKRDARPGSGQSALVRVIRVRPFVKALVLAFDGLVADTLELRADAVEASLRLEGVQLKRELIEHALPGRSLHETISTIIGVDDPRVDLAALRAQQELARRMAQGVSLTRDARAFLERERVNGTRLVLRTDSPRRDVEAVLQLTDLEMAFAFVRCADDLPRTRGVSTLEGSYAAISQRLDALRVTQRQAIECGALGVEVATRLIGSARLAQRLSVEAPGR